MEFWFAFYRIWFWFRSLFKSANKDLSLVGTALWKSKDQQAEDWSREALGAENDRVIIKGSSQSGESIVINVTFGPEKTAIANILLKFPNDKTYSAVDIPGNAISNSLLVAGPLRLECREPFKRWRLTIRGTLLDDAGEPHPIRFLSWFSPTTDESNFLASLVTKKLAEIATINESTSVAESLSDRKDFFQWGLLRSQASIDDKEPREFDLRVVRIKTGIPFTGEAALSEVFSATLNYGSRIFCARLGFPQTHKTVCIGQIVRGDFIHQNVNSFLDDYAVIETDKGSYVLETAHDEARPDFFNAWNDAKIESKLIQWDFNTEVGYGTRLTSIENLRNNVNDKITVPQRTPVEYTATSDEKQNLVVPFEAKAAQDTLFTGGKGSNLAKLTQIQNDFQVPTGFVVTVTAFESYLQAHKKLKSSIESAALTLRPGDSEAIKKFEIEIQSLIAETDLSSDLKLAINAEFNRLYGGASPDNAIRVAVRSSAVGEDGAELSSAGQLETFLEVPLSEVPRRILECWASNFRREIVSYRLQNAQPINTSVAVVVQEMVVGGMAGVLFTTDPVKGDPNRLVINVVEGLGEALVSGQATPDEIVLTRKLKIVSKPSTCKFSDANAIALAKAGLAFENTFGGPQDVEFAVKDDKLYILQTRCITNLDLETDWEFEHEFDNATIADSDILSTANVGEVIPAPMTPLEVSVLVKLYDRAVNAAVAQISNPIGLKPFERVEIAFQIARQRVFINLTEMYLRNWPVVEKDPVPEYSLAGRKVFTAAHVDSGRRRFGNTHKRNDGKSLLSMLKVMFLDSEKYCGYGSQILANIAEVEANAAGKKDTVENQLETIVELQKHVWEAIDTHTKASMFSSFTYVFVAMLLRGSPEGDLTPEILTDIAMIYAENPEKPISADVPKALQRLAAAIVANGHEEKFNAFNDAVEAYKWLQSLDETDKAGEEARQFMKLHGFRGQYELMLQGTAWKDDPSQVVSNLKSLITQLKQNPSTDAESKPSEGSVIDRLKSTQITGIKRKFFQFFMNKAHRGVFIREELKNVIVQATYALRQACLRLGIIMYDKCLLPSARSILFLTLDEIEDLYATKNPRILHRLRRREKIFAKQAEHRYACVNVGTPQPLELDAKACLGTELHGTAVCEGIVRGRARVAKSLAEASETQPGEILITRYTDIYWSPYFPIIRGLVTEIGGLLSHGSVVAREYGLPCVIAVENATDVFQTGDEVILNAGAGVIAKVLQEASN
uniref:Phosphoenolpyruvate synthase n=1 Tax=Panagrellus redivivus TaxID=6233 RepID=A0A7E4UQT9_PANRE